MNHRIFYMINNHYLMLTRSDKDKGLDFLPVSYFSGFENKGVYKGYILNKNICNVFDSEKRYICVKGERYLSFFKVGWALSFSLRFSDSGMNYIEAMSHFVVDSFRHGQKESLLNDITTKNVGLHGYLEFLADYVFCEHFSLWTYNGSTGVFTCEATSLEENGGFFRSNDECALADILEEGYSGFEARKPKEGYINSDVLNRCGIKSVNRIKLDIGFNYDTPAVVNFYSAREGFYLSERASERLKRLVESKYLESVQIAEEQFDSLATESFPDIKSESVRDYLKRFCEIVCEKLQYEACSILFINVDGDLQLVATNDKKGSRFVKNVIYSLDKESMTTQVALRNLICCSYDLESEEANSHTYDEETRHPPKNWVGVPIVINAEVVGVVRVKNKYIEKDGVTAIRPPRPIHFYNLERMKSILESSVDIYQKYDELYGKLEEHDNFNKVMLHEIRTPISKFNMGPEIIKAGLRKEEIPDDRKDKYIRQLTDIQVLGGRLKLLTDAYNFEQLVANRKVERIPLQQGIVYPIINITKPYLERQHGCYVFVDMNSMHSWHVVGDRDLYTIALNALVDNAAKYCSGDSKRIIIECEHDYGDDYLYLKVKNRGVPINKGERKRIFDNGYRGKEARDEKIHGTGIGLYLAKTIMSESGGDLSLIPRKDLRDIEFVMKIPVSKSMEY